MEGNLPFLPRFTCVFEGNFQVQAPRGPYISRGDLGADHLRGGVGDCEKNFLQALVGRKKLHAAQM